MRVAYLINQYPAISHSFIRREIAALERCGAGIARFSIRSSANGAISPEDRSEAEKTRTIVGAGPFAIGAGILASLLSRPQGSLAAIGKAIRLGARSDAGMVRHFFYAAEALVLASWLRRDAIAHVHAHFGTNSAAVAMLAARVNGGTFSMTVHGPEEFDRAAHIALAEKIEAAAFVAAVSNYGASQLRRLVPPEHWDRIAVIPCGVECAFYEEARTPSVAFGDTSPAVAGEVDARGAVPPPPLAGEVSPKATEGALAASPAHADRARPLSHASRDSSPASGGAGIPLLVSVGRLSEQKGQLTLIDAAAEARARGARFRLLLIGDGDMRGDIEAAIGRHGLAETVELAGWKTPDEVRAAILSARAFVLPSYAEGLPVSIMEAMLLSRPVISTYVAGIPELVVPGESGWLVPAADSSALAGAMIAALAATKERIAEMGAAAKARAQARHDIDSIAPRLKAMFEQALEG